MKATRRVLCSLGIVAGATACTERAAHVLEPRTTAKDIAGLETVVVIDSQPNYYRADVTITVAVGSIPHYTPMSIPPAITYRITRQRANSNAVWSSRSDYTGRYVGSIETDDNASYRRIYNAAGTLYAPVFVEPAGQPFGGPPFPDQPTPFPSLPPGVIPWGLPRPANGASRSSDFGTYVIEAARGQQMIRQLQLAGATVLAAKGDTVSFRLARGSVVTALSFSRSSGAPLQISVRDGERNIVLIRHFYRELRLGVFAKVKSVIHVFPSAEGQKAVDLVSTSENIAYEYREGAR